MSDDYDPGLHFEVPTERCLFCGTEVTPGQLIGNTLANGAMPKMAEIAMRAMRAHTDELGALRKRVTELQAGLDEACDMLMRNAGALELRELDRIGELRELTGNSAGNSSTGSQPPDA